MPPIIALAIALSQYAPQILRFFGAGQKPVAVAEKVVAIAQAVTGAPTGEAALEKLKADAALAAAFQEKVLAADLELDRLALADLQDARVRDIEVRRLNAGKNERADLMVIGAVVGLISCLAVLVFFRKDIPGEAVGIIATVAGVFGACLRDAYQFEFGSSRGSKEKDALIAEQLTVTRS